ncbi:MAG: DUF5684 domain-containing protein [Bacteroidia bacterium]|nr:DUF5684 domain-containing protein [Bacteroidia bacterium]
MGFDFILLSIFLLFIASIWTVFEKAGRPGWYALIPVWNVYQLVKIAGMRGISMLLLLVPIVSLFYIFGLNMRIARAFGKDQGFGIGLTLLGFVFWPMLAFGDAEYHGQDHDDFDQQRHVNEEKPAAKDGYLDENGDWIEEVPISEW